LSWTQISDPPTPAALQSCHPTEREVVNRPAVSVRKSN